MGKRKLTVLLVVMAGAVWVFPAMVWSQDQAGVSLTISVDATNADFQFALGDPIKLIMVSKNTLNWPINTERGYSQEELHKFLIITDPSGARKTLSQDAAGHKMPPTFFLNGRPMTPAETLPAAWIKSATIGHLEILFPSMQTTPGWYTIEAQQPFVRFAWTIQDPGLGLLGVADADDNWYGAVKSNKLQIFIAPPAGAKVSVRVLNQAANPAEPLSQVPVRIFRQSDLPPGYTPQEVWNTIETVLSGTTDFDGNTTWESGSSCITEDEYAIIAKYAGQYKEVPIGTRPSETGWAPGCSGSISKTVAFGASVVAADMDGDGDGDGKDLAAFSAAFAAGNMAADLNNDGSVNAADVGAFAAGFGRASSGTGAAPLLQTAVGDVSVPNAAVEAAPNDKKSGAVKKKNKK